MTPLELFNETDARAFYGVLSHYQNEYTELRALDPESNEIRDRDYVQNESAFIEFCSRNSGKHTVWAGLNPRKTRAGKNEDIARRTTILIDIDYHHKDQPATEEEIQQALESAEKTVSHLKAKGHPQPYVDMSGNGVHILLMVELPAQPDLSDKIQAFYKTLPVDVDPKNADLARMCRVTGTYNLKASRLTYVVSPSEWEQDKTLELQLTGENIGNITIPPPPTQEQNKTSSKKLRSYLNKMRPCIRAMLTNENEGAHGTSGDLDHEAHLLIVKDAQYNGLGAPDICALFLQQPDYKKGVTEKRVAAAVNDNAQRGITPWYCENLIKRGWCITQESALCLAARWDPETKKDKKQETTDKGAELIKLAKEHAVTFFRDQYQTGYATINDSSDSNDGIPQTYRVMKENENKLGDLKSTVIAVTTVIKSIPLKSNNFKWWIARLHHKTTGTTISSETINSAILVLEAETQLKPVRFLYNRFAPNGTLSYWWDMGDDSGRSLHVSGEGWKVENSPPQIFRRYAHIQPISEPVRGGSLEPFLNYLNLEEPGDKLLAITAAISYLIPEIPHVGTTITGRQGSGKSTFHLLLQNLIDPSGVDLLNLPSKDEDLKQILEHHYLSIFDNVTKLTQSQSDILCRAITGAGNEKRELYTTDESFIRKYMRCIGLNGITVPIEKSDLFSRNLLLPWEPIKDNERHTDAEMKAQMLRDAPGLIGGMLDILVKAIQIYPSIKTKLNVRMADYAKWGCAITVALGLKQSDFEAAYRRNIRSQDEEAVRASMVAEMIIRYMRVQGEDIIEGSATDLKKLIEGFENPPDYQGKPMGDLLSRREGWPKNAARFGRELVEVAPALEALGYKVSVMRTGSARGLRVQRIVAGNASVTEKGQRSFETVDPDELTDSKLRAALIDAVISI
jgi:hypothetical protein